MPFSLSVLSSVEFSIEMAIYLILVPAAIWAICKIRREGGFKWVQLLIWLTVLTNLGQITFDYYFYRLNDPAYL